MFHKASHNQYIFPLSLLLVLVVSSFILYSPGKLAPVKAQTCPLACQSNGDACRIKTSNDPAIPVAYRNTQCNQIPCQFRDAYGCGGCLNGCADICRSCGGTGGSGGGGGGTGGSGGVPSTPGGTGGNPSTPGGVPSTPGGTSTTPGGTNTNPTGTQGPLSTECANKCDRNKDGKMTKDDFKDIISSTNPADKELIQYCSQSCPWSDGTGGTGGGTNTTPVPRDSSMGDCSGSQPGVPDGKVTLQDVEYFRQELNKEVQTLSCDFDKSGKTDIIDFTNYLREGFTRSNGL